MEINLNLLMYLTILGCAVVCLFVFIDLKKYKHYIRVRQLVNGRTVVHDVKAKEVNEKDGSLYWRLRKFKENIPVPPPEAIDINVKGRFVVEAYRDSNGTYSFINDTGKDVKSFQPLTTKQRTLLIHQMRKAEARKSKRWQDALVPIASMSILGIVCIALFVFWGDLAKPALEMGDKINSITAKQAEISNQQNQIWESIIEQKQTIREEPKGPVKPPDEP